MQIYTSLDRQASSADPGTVFETKKAFRAWVGAEAPLLSYRHGLPRAFNFVRALAGLLYRTSKCRCRYQALHNFFLGTGKKKFANSFPGKKGLSQMITLVEIQEFEASVTNGRPYLLSLIHI